MTTTNLARGVAFNWLGRACAIAITFVVTPIVIHGLGNEAYGIWSIVMSLGAYYALANFGLRAAGVKYISQFDAVNDHQSVNKVVVTMLVAYLPLAALVLLLAGGISAVFPVFIQTEHLADNTVRCVIIVAGLSVSVGIVGQVFAATLIAFRRFGQINAVAVITQVVQAIMIVTAIRNGWGLLGMAWTILIVMILQQLWTFVLAMRTVGHLTLAFEFFDWSTLRLLLSFGTLNVCVAMARRVINYGGSFIIGVFLGPVMVAFYAVALGLALKLEDLGKGVNSVLMPVVSQLDAQNLRSDLVEMFFLVSRTLLAVAIAVATVFIALGQPLIAMWIGPEYASQSYPVLCLLAVSMAIRMPKNSAANVLKGTNRVNLLAKVALAEAILTLILGVVFVRSLGILGMGYAVLVSETLFAGVLLNVTCRTIEISLLRYVYGVCVPGAVAAMPGVAVAFGMSLLMPPSQLIHVVLQALCVMMVAGVATFTACFDQQLRRRIFHCIFPGTVRFSRS